MLKINRHSRLFSLLVTFLITSMCLTYSLTAAADETNNATTVSNIQQNTKKITGCVTDKNGEPIIGATVSEKGKGAGTATDAAGNYTLNVSGNATLVIS